MRQTSRSLSDRAYYFLSSQIISGRIRYGQRLNIKALAGRLRMSAMPVRDALKMLQVEKIVEIKPRSNCVVRIPTRRSVLDAFEMRRRLELQAVELAHGSATAVSLAPMHRTVRSMGRMISGAPGRQAVRRYIDLDQIFHTQLCRLPGNEYLEKFYREVCLHLNMAFTYEIGAVPDLQGTYADHVRLLELLEQRSARAVDLLATHLHRSLDEILRGTIFAGLG